MKHFIDDRNIYQLSTDDESFIAPETWISVDSAPSNILQKWDGKKWVGSVNPLSVRYGSFRVAMLGSFGWGRIKKLVPPDLVAELMASIAYMESNPKLVRLLWNRIISALGDSDKPTTSEIEQWQAIVRNLEIDANSILNEIESFNFDETGRMFKV